MDKKKSLTKAGSSSKTAQLPSKKTTQKPDKKRTSVKAEKKKEVGVKPVVSRSKSASETRKLTKTSADKEKGKEKKASKTKTKTSSSKIEIKKTPEKKQVKSLSVSKSASPEKKQLKKSPVKPAVSKTKAAPGKRVEVLTPKKAATEKTGKGVSGKIAVKATKRIKAAAEAETAPIKGKKSAAKAAKTIPKKKAAAKESPVTKETAGAKLKPAGKAVRPQAAPRKKVKKKVKTAASKGITKITEIQKKTAAIYSSSPRREKKLKRAFDLKVFLPEEELPEEEFQILSPPELPEEYGENELLLLEVDPSRVFASWEIKPEDIAGEAGKLILRVYDVTGMDLDMVQSAGFFDIPIRQRVDSKFFDIKMPGRDVIMEIGLLYPEGSFKAIKRSHRISMPALQNFEELGITGLLSDSDSLIGY